MTNLPGGGHAFSSLKWTKPVSPATFSTHALFRSMKSPDWNLTRLLNVTGGIDFESMGITQPKDKAITLLRAAAEIEHQFIVQYLYAHYCGGSDSGTLMVIAQEEMGHLLTVQKLLAILGEPPYLERLKGISSENEPSPFHLEPYRLPFIARFLVAESGVKDELPANLDQVLADDDLTIAKINHVGTIYAMLYWLFQNSKAPSGVWTLPLGADLSGLQELGHLEDDDFADVATVAKRLNIADNWFGAVLEPVNEDENILVAPSSPAAGDTKANIRQTALRAIHFVAGQGEGATDQPGDKIEKSHAHRLRELYDQLSGQAVKPASPFPIDPYFDATPGATPDQPNKLTNLEAISAAQEVDKQYEIILLFIVLSMLPDTMDRGTPSSSAVDAMHSLAISASDIVTKPLKEGGNPAVLAGPTFNFPTEGIPLDEARIKARLTELGVVF